MSLVKDLVCVECGERYPLGTLFPCRKCGGFLDVDYDYARISEILTRSRIKNRKATLWKYRELLPLKSWDRIVTLDEGGTPLIECRRVDEVAGVKKLYVKDETRNPTGSFKDRHATVIVSMAVENGVRKIFTVSSGNESAALGCYCSRAGIESLAFVHIYESDSIKLSQTRFYGTTIGVAPARKEKIEHFWRNPLKKNAGGSFFGSGKIFEEAYYKYGWYPSTAGPINPYHKEGYKTIAYEICEQLNWETPDFVIIPVGSGDNLAAEWKGFNELRSLGLINKLPRIVATQHHETKSLTKQFSGHRLSRKCVEESRGYIVNVSSKEEKEYLRLLASKEGLLVEPTSAQPVASVKRLSDEGTISKSDLVVCIGTGSGIKYPEIASSMSAKPRRVRASFTGMLELLAKHRATLR